MLWRQVHPDQCRDLRRPQLNSQTCSSQGFACGSLACADNCSAFDTDGCTTCGDNNTNGPDFCDGSDLNGQTCMASGFDMGSWRASSTARRYNQSGCGDFCGNGMIDNMEDCDSGMLGGVTCATVPGQTYDAGTLTCNNMSCTFNDLACTDCGDGIKEGAEECDDGNMIDNDLCGNDCKPPVCGDNVMEGNEQCDGGVGGATCNSVNAAFDGGTLSCNNGACTYNTSACTDCGNGAKEAGEVCDGGDLGGQTCMGLDPLLYDGGTLGCNPGCGGFNVSMCNMIP